MKAKIAITIETEMLKQIDELVEELNLNRSQFIENVLSVGLADAQLLKTLGFMDLAKLVIRVRDKVAKRSSKGRTHDGE
jgi:metal-responsive CopG/Arc/MetJ family transcriptional regulator